MSRRFGGGSEEVWAAAALPLSSHSALGFLRTVTLNRDFLSPCGQMNYADTTDLLYKRLLCLEASGSLDLSEVGEEKRSGTGAATLPHVYIIRA